MSQSKWFGAGAGALAAVLIAGAATAVLSAEVEQTRARDTAAERTETTASPADAWGLDATDWTRYEHLMSGRRGLWSPDADPLLVLGAHARTPAERRRFAEAYVAAEMARVEGELAFERAVGEAWVRLYGDEEMFASAPAGNPAASPAVRFAVAVDADCVACRALVRRYWGGGRPVDFHVLGTGGRDGQGRVSVAVAPARPLVDFMVVGAQKCGTTALASILAAHPEIGMAAPKETHLFDDPEYGPHWTRARIDARYAGCLRECTGARLRGEATPVYLYFPEVAAELARYNPDLKLIVLLRDPAERAVWHYHMERGRGAEGRPLWLALLLEPLLLRRDRAPRGKGSATRERSYRARGRYGRQLANLHRHFPPERVLVLRQADLLEDHDAALRRTFAFLGVDPDVRVPPARCVRGSRRFRELAG